MKKLPLVLVISSALFIGLVILVVMAAVDQAKKSATLDIQSVVPDDISVTVDGKKVASTTKFKVVPGTHTINAKRQGFGEQNQSVVLKDKETKTIRLMLIVTGPEGKAWVAAHPDQAVQAESVSSQRFDDISKQVTDKNPIISHLPILRREWRIDYGQSQKHPDDPQAIQLIITYASEPSKQDALDWMRAQGFNPDSYEIV